MPWAPGPLLLPLPHPSAKLGIMEFWLPLRGPSSDESPSAGLERNCQPETTRELPSVKPGEGGKDGKCPEKAVLSSVFSRENPADLTSAQWWDRKSRSQGTWSEMRYLARRRCFCLGSSSGAIKTQLIQEGEGFTNQGFNKYKSF